MMAVGRILLAITTAQIAQDPEACRSKEKSNDSQIKLFIKSETIRSSTFCEANEEKVRLSIFVEFMLILFLEVE
jgi:hypothetical protein